MARLRHGCAKSSKHHGTHPFLLWVCRSLELHWSPCVCAAGQGVCLDLSMCETDSKWCTFLTHSVSKVVVNAECKLSLLLSLSLQKKKKKKKGLCLVMHCQQIVLRFFLFWHSLCFSLKCCRRITVCCEDFLKSLPYCLFFVTSPYKCLSLLFSLPLLSSLLFLPHAPLHFLHSAFQFSPPLLALSPLSSCILDPSRCSPDRVSCSTPLTLP